MTPCVIGRGWEGRTVAVLCSGPSMSQEVADRVRGLPAIVTNNTFRLAPWADILHAADASWWRNTPDAMSFAGVKMSCEQFPGVLLLGRAGKVGYCDDADKVHTFGNSGAQAIQIAAKAGAKRILLCGMDMNGGHWHGDHMAPLRETHQDTYAIWREQMGVLADALEQRGVEVLNCSPSSALTCWPKVGLEEALARAI